MHGSLSFAETRSGPYITVQRGDKEVNILIRMKNKQIQYCGCIPEGERQREKMHIRPGMQIYMQETDGSGGAVVGGNQE